MLLTEFMKRYETERERQRYFRNSLSSGRQEKTSSLKFLGESTKMWCMAFRNQDVEKGVLIKDKLA